MRSRFLALSCIALAIAASSLFAQTAPSPADGPQTAPAGQGRQGRGPGGGGFGGGAGGGGFGRGPGGPGGGGAPGGGGRSILDMVAIQGGDNSRIAHEHLLAKAKLAKGKVDVYFEGDSIFRRWGCDPKAEPNYAKYYANWKENFWGWNAADFAWGADSLQNILWRLRNGELDDINPKAVVFLGGTNNVTGSNNVDDMTKGLTACFDEIHKKAPDTTLIIVGILPRQQNFQATIDAINANLKKLDDGKKTRFVDVKAKFFDADGKMLPGMLNSDSLHPDTKGYQAVADGIKPILTQLLGPPAKDDHAPPPTADPKVMPTYPPAAGG